jgi:AcrR family transcriptional regulator
MKLFTRYRILNATRAMVAEVGVERVGMRGIAALANITAAAIYKHFRNKKALLDEVVAHGYRELSYAMLKEGKGNLEKMADSGRKFAERHSRLFEMMVAPQTNDEEAVKRLEHEAYDARKRKELKEPNARRAAVAIWSEIRGFLARRAEGNLRERFQYALRPLLAA